MNVLDTALRGTLTASTALTSLLSGTGAIYHLHAPDGAVMPYVVFNLQGGGPDNITPSDMRNYVEFVRGYSGSAATAASIDTAINALLDGKTLSTTGYTNFWTKRETDIESADLLPSGERIYSAGALFRIRIDQ